MIAGRTLYLTLSYFDIENSCIPIYDLPTTTQGVEILHHQHMLLRCYTDFYLFTWYQKQFLLENKKSGSWENSCNRHISA